MIEINMLEPKGNWSLWEKWRGTYTITFRPKGQFLHTCLQISLWGLPETKKSWYTARKVQRIIHYQQN